MVVDLNLQEVYNKLRRPRFTTKPPFIMIKNSKNQ